MHFSFNTSTFKLPWIHPQIPTYPRTPYSKIDSVLTSKPHPFSRHLQPIGAYFRPEFETVESTRHYPIHIPVKKHSRLKLFPENKTPENTEKKVPETQIRDLKIENFTSESSTSKSSNPKSFIPKSQQIFDSTYIDNLVSRALSLSHYLSINSKDEEIFPE